MAEERKEKAMIFYSLACAFQSLNWCTKVHDNKSKGEKF